MTNKEIVDRYSFLFPTGEERVEFNYQYVPFLDDLPEGWHKLFLQMCEDIRQPLIDSGYFEKFYFLQVKEKYASMVCYHGGAPDEVCKIIDKYEHISQFICEFCGKPADYTYTGGWITQVCENCAKEHLKQSPDSKYLEPIKFSPILTFTGYRDTTSYDCSDIWERYIKN